jgi:hypothetical protein
VAEESRQAAAEVALNSLL